MKDKYIDCNKVISTIPLPFVSKMIPKLPKKTKELYNSKKNIACVCVILKLSKN